ncbi:uncharacterized protein LOC126318441 isoform X1 [Schistocerca gregaria]|uniref:uncharacterized protein LOC126318441 isoform X1 n=1 Tax=Schistocerca gregaria TaxID=7010 RepID=UPI00211EAF39|nr:uncharacterized protein LOC126318441 isoform X1 [Schistocerca gregaria]
MYRSCKLIELNRVQRRGYVVKPNVEKVVLTPGRPIGRVGFLFSKLGTRTQEAQNQNILRRLDMCLHPVETKFTEEQRHERLEGLLCLETAVKLVEKPELLRKTASLEVKKDANIRAVAWLREIDTISEAAELASKPDEMLLNQLKYEMTLGEVLSVNTSVGLRLPLDTVAPVETWWTAYAAANKLQRERVLFSTVTGIPFNREEEEAMRLLGLACVYKCINRYLKNEISKNMDSLLPKVLKESCQKFGPVLRGDKQGTLQLIDKQAEVIRKLKSVPVNEWTAGEIVDGLIEVRDQFREVGLALLYQAGLHYEASTDSSVIESWNIINEAHLRGSADQVKAAVQQLKAIYAQSKPSDIELIQSIFPDEVQALNSALGQYSELAESISEDLLAEQFARRAIDLSHKWDLKTINHPEHA